MKKILVTGANGQLGSHLKDIMADYNSFEFKFTDLPELDITNETAVETFFENYQPDWVINCAAYTAVDKAEEEPEKADLLNVTAPALLARLSDKYSTRLLHISTDYVFGGHAHIPYAENSPKSPAGVYAQSKSRGEDLVMVTNPRSIIVRTSWLYSVYGANFMKTISRIACEKGNLRVVSDQIGSPTWAGDLADALMMLVSMDAQPGFYHYSNEGVCSWYDFAKAIVYLQQIDCTVEPVNTAGFPTKAVRPPYSVLDKSRYKSVTKTSIPWWFDSLRKCVEQFKIAEKNRKAD